MEKIQRKYAQLFCCLMHKHQAGTKIEAIQRRIKGATDMLQRYQVQSNTSEPMSRWQPPRSYPHSNDDDYVVGLEEDIQKLVEQLTTTSEQVESNVVCIVGMGGCGKPTLARKLYNRLKIKQHFQCRAWICVSQEWDARHILNEILRQTGHNTSTEHSWSIEQLVEVLFNFLEQNLYIVVLDDVWRQDALRDLLPAFPYRNISSGSKIIITSRNQEIFRSADLYCSIHKPQRLNYKQGWELFSKIALKKRETNMDNDMNMTNFETLGKMMLDKCDGLPLAIVSLAGILRFKKNIEEWEMVDKAVSSRIMEGRGTREYGTVKDMLALSYHDLPFYLKPCFLYLGLFPEDCEILIGILIRMWIAEGFITSWQLSGRQTLEDVARQHIDELVQRCMIRVAERNYAGIVKAIKIHDLMRDFCIEKAKEQDFLELISSEYPCAIGESTIMTQGMGMASRRAIVYFYARGHFPSNNSRVRSLYLFGQANLGIHKFHLVGAYRANLTLEPICKNFMLLRVLNLVAIDVPNGIFPSEFGTLIHLRYLGIRSTNIVQLPKSIQNLRNLLTLDYRGIENDTRYTIRVSRILWKLKQLGHLYLPYNRESMEEEMLLHKLQNLQTLYGVGVGNWMLKEVEHLSPKLKKLHITGISTHGQLQATFRCPSIVLDHLHSLYLDFLHDDVVLQNLRSISQLRRLYKLGLRGTIDGTSGPISFPPNLKKLELLFTYLGSHSTMEAIGRLAQLKVLRMSRCSYVSSEWTCTANMFPNLEELHLLDLPNLKEWRLENGAMSCLKKLELIQCEKLECLPIGLKVITTLQELVISSMPANFCSRLQKESNEAKGEDAHIIQHIPFVRIRN